MSLEKTLGNEQWLRDNEKAIYKLLPETWTHVNNINGLQLGYGLKLLGIDWRSESDFGKIMVYFEKIGMMLRDGMTVRRNVSSIFK